MELSERITKYLARCKPAVSGQHGHDRTFATACVLTWGFALSVEAALPFMLDFNSRCDPRWRERDLLRKLTQAATHQGHTRPRGYLLDGTADYVPPSKPLPRPEPTWPQPDLTAIDRIVPDGPGLCDLWEVSPVRFDGGDSHAEEIIDILFPGNPLLCVAKSSYEFGTDWRENWREQLASQSLIVPSPMVAVRGQTQDGRVSEHTKAATGRRAYLVIEFDFSERDKRGNETVWAPLIRKWRNSGIDITDACASLTFHLHRQLNTLVCCCHSGGKSLHGWFRVRELSPESRIQFMRQAVLLGADRATWCRSQFARLPDGFRDNGNRQTCYFLNPQEAVKP